MSSDSPRDARAEAKVDLRVPILPGKGASDYERYLRIDELLGLQKNAGELLHPDELTFQVVHQSSELLMKACVHELQRSCSYIGVGDYGNALRLLHRSNQMLDYPVALLHVLETITPYEYQVIRGGLGHGSGLDSPGFLGLLHIAPRLGDAFFEQLHKTGLNVLQLYRRWQEFLGLHDVAEALLDYDERLQLFRYHHLKLAERIIGRGVIGTMGTPVEVLKQRQEHVFYKELWDVRNQITAEINEATGI